MSNNAKSFSWEGLNKAGKRVNGTVTAVDIKTAHVELAKQGIEVINLKSVHQYNISLGGKKVKPKNILLFTRFLSTMLSAGLPIIQGLDVISKDQENEVMKSFVITLRNNIAGGKTLAESFAQFPNYFDTLYCSLIRAGEKSGTLDSILSRLANYLEKTERLKSKLKKAMVYPAAIITISFLVSSILLLFVVPKFQGLFDSFGAQLPLFTRMVIGLSNFMQSYWWIVVIFIVGGIWLIKYALRTKEAFRVFLDKKILNLIVVGPVLRKGIIARFTRTLATTLEAGMPITEALESMVPIMGNSVYSKAVLQVRNDVMSGHQLSASLNTTKLFPNMVVQMIAVGEASGSLAEMLNKVAEYYEEEVNNIVDNLSSLLEPIIMLILGVIIGGLVIAMYLPIFKLGSLF
jgi:type IV pilus assembly protein PilC